MIYAEGQGLQRAGERNKQDIFRYRDKPCEKDMQMAAYESRWDVRPGGLEAKETLRAWRDAG